jgi:hypothetical protein
MGFIGSGCYRDYPIPPRDKFRTSVREEKKNTKEPRKSLAGESPSACDARRSPRESGGGGNCSTSDRTPRRKRSMVICLVIVSILII